MARPAPRIGIRLPQSGPGLDWSNYAAMAQAAEESGFDSVWLGDDLTSHEDDQLATPAARTFDHGDEADRNTPLPDARSWDKWTLLTTIANATQRVAIGPLVVSAAFHPPAFIAKMAVAVHAASSGRLVLGLGADWDRPEFQILDMPYDQRVSRFESSYSIIRALVHDTAALPAPVARVPVMIATNARRALEITLPTAEIWNTGCEACENSPEGFARLNERVTAIAEQLGRPPQEIRRSVCVRISSRSQTIHRQGDSVPAAVTGTPRQIAARVDEFAQAGADEVILDISEVDERAIRSLAEITVD